MSSRSASSGPAGSASGVIKPHGSTLLRTIDKAVEQRRTHRPQHLLELGTGFGRIEPGLLIQSLQKSAVVVRRCKSVHTRKKSALALLLMAPFKETILSGRAREWPCPTCIPSCRGSRSPPYISIFAAGVVAAVSYPLMRLSDAAAVITSFALLVVLHTIMVHWSAMTNGPRTFFGVPKATDLSLAAGFAIGAIGLALMFKESRTGLLLRAVRDDEAAAEATGAHVSVLRWRGFVRSALMAGLGGALWGRFITSFSPKAFYLKETFVILGMLVIGGPSTVSGAVVGGLSGDLRVRGPACTGKRHHPGRGVSASGRRAD